jgi:hypothetical protein
MIASAAVTSAKIGERNLAFVGTFIVPDNEVATFNTELRVGTDPTPIWSSVGFNSKIMNINVTLEFVEGPGEVGWNFDAPNFRFIFRGWKNPLGNALKTPLRAGTFSVGIGPKTEFGFLITSYYLEPMNIVTLQIVTGGTYEPLI